MNQMRKPWYFVIISTVIISLTGCTAISTKKYETPVIPIPTEFKNTQIGTSREIMITTYRDDWWTVFNDQQLNLVVNQVLTSNSDLIIAGMTLKQARLRADLTKDQQNVRINSNMTTGHSFDTKLNQDYSQGISANLGISYEIDLFGKLSSQTEVSEWQALVTEKDLQATAQILIADTLKLYGQLGSLNERHDLILQDIETLEKKYQLVRVKYNNGKASGLDLAQAEQSTQFQKTNLSQIQQQLVETRTALAILMHKPLQQLNIVEPSSLKHITLPEINAGLPSVILAHRPDVKSSELQLRKVFASKNATRASYYPSMSLTGNLGGASTSLTKLISNPLLTLGANLSFPFLQYNQMKKDISISDLEYQKAVVAYRQTLYKALAEVENALSKRTELNHQFYIERNNVQLSQKIENIIRIKYENGAVELNDLLEAEKTSRNAELSFIQTQQEQYNSYIFLLQALGGNPLKNGE